MQAKSIWTDRRGLPSIDTRAACRCCVAIAYVYMMFYPPPPPQPPSDHHRPTQHIFLVLSRSRWCVVVLNGGGWCGWSCAIDCRELSTMSFTHVMYYYWVSDWMDGGRGDQWNRIDWCAHNNKIAGQVPINCRLEIWDHYYRASARHPFWHFDSWYVLVDVAALLVLDGWLVGWSVFLLRCLQSDKSLLG